MVKIFHLFVPKLVVWAVYSVRRSQEDDASETGKAWETLQTEHMPSECKGGWAHPFWPSIPQWECVPCDVRLSNLVRGARTSDF